MIINPAYDRDVNSPRRWEHGVAEFACLCANFAGTFACQLRLSVCREAHGWPTARLMMRFRLPWEAMALDQTAENGRSAAAFFRSDRPPQPKYFYASAPQVACNLYCSLNKPNETLRQWPLQVSENDYLAILLHRISQRSLQPTLIRNHFSTSSNYPSLTDNTHHAHRHDRCP